MKSELEIPVRYHLPVGEELVYLNDLIGNKIELNYLGEIHPKVIIFFIYYK